MQRLGIVIAAALCTTIVSSAPSQAAVGQGVAAAADTLGLVEKAGCYRLGETGYHWYRFCVGPSWLYPHRRVCRHRACRYR